MLVLHGTDTATLTSAALALLCDGLAVPVALTGSNVSHDVPGTGARNNISGAISALRELAPGSYLVLSGHDSGPSSIFAGTHVRKAHAGGQPSRSVVGPPWGTVGGDGLVQLATTTGAERDLPPARAASRGR